MGDDSGLINGTRVEPTTFDSNKKKEIMNQLILVKCSKRRDWRRKRRQEKVQRLRWKRGW